MTDVPSQMLSDTGQLFSSGERLNFGLGDALCPAQYSNMLNFGCLAKDDFS